MEWKVRQQDKLAGQKASRAEFVVIDVTFWPSRVLIYTECNFQVIQGIILINTYLKVNLYNICYS